MEKIYMENNQNNKQSNFQKFMQSKGSIICSFVLAFVAVVSLISAGFNQVSYAIPDVENHLPDQFETAEVNATIIGSRGEFNVVQYHTSSGIPVFCLEHGVDFCESHSYTKGDMITDYGLLYVMANSYPNKDFMNDGQKLNNYLQTWITQVSIWVYLNEAAKADNITDPTYLAKIQLSEEDLAAIKSETGVYVETIDDYDDGMTAYSAGGKNLYTTYIEPLVSQALAVRHTPNKTLNISREDEEITVSGDEEYYETSMITVTGSPSENFNGFKLELSQSPNGTKIIGEDGQEMTELDNLSTGTKFYLRIPIANVTEENKTIQLSVTGSFKTYEGNYYVASECQTISSVETVNNNVNKGLDIELNYTPEVPDTSMSTAQTVYFIGLIVLLSGIGIIYANAKTSENR